MINIFRFICILSVILIAVSPPSVAIDNYQILDDAKLNEIAIDAFHILKDVPYVGLDSSQLGLEKLILIHHQLSRTTNNSQGYLSLVLADSIAFAIITEIHRSEVARMQTANSIVPESIPFDKKTAIKLWKANKPKFLKATKKQVTSNDIITRYATAHFLDEDMFNGFMVNKAPLEKIRPRIRELHEKVSQPFALSKNPTADEQLIYTLTKFQAFRDLGVIINLYEKGDLPNNLEMFENAIDGEIKGRSEMRADDGMRSSPFKIWLTYEHYYPENTSQDSVGQIEEYTLRQALSLAPFMTNTSSLPELAKKTLINIQERLPPTY